MLGFAHADGSSTRILVDPWLSDHAVGDGLGRFPRVRFDPHDLAPIDAVYLTHGHSDHLDPYTLVRLWRELEHPPVLLLPASLAFLVQVFERHLPNVQVVVLFPHQAYTFGGVELLGFYDVNEFPTNEDDVMVLVVTHGSERVLVEADANLSFEHPDVCEFVVSLMRDPSLESVVFLTTENELTGTMQSRTCRSLTERREVMELAYNEMLEEVERLYTLTNGSDGPWAGGRVLRLIHGQGLAAPHELDPRWQRILFPVRTDHRVREEREAAQRRALELQVDQLEVGAVHTIQAGRVVSRDVEPSLRLLDEESQRDFDAGLEFFPVLPLAPLRSGERDRDLQLAKIEDLLNQRFLPYLHGVRLPPVIHLLTSYGGSYTVRVHFGEVENEDAIDFVLGFTGDGFIATPCSGFPQESYWANDLEDFLDGRCDEFSGTTRTAFPGMEFRLLACLAVPLLNSDLMTKRVALHFERANAGLTPASFVLELYRDVRG